MSVHNFVVGQGATYLIGSDRYPYTVVEIISPKKVILQADNYYRTDKNGTSESQKYDYSPNIDADLITVTLRKDGQWRKQGSFKSGVFSFKGRNAHKDPSF